MKSSEKNGRDIKFENRSIATVLVDPECFVCLSYVLQWVCNVFWPFPNSHLRFCDSHNSENHNFFLQVQNSSELAKKVVIFGNMGITKSQMRVWERSENVANPLYHLGQTNKTLGVDQNHRNRAILEFVISTIFFWARRKSISRIQQGTRNLFS